MGRRRGCWRVRGACMPKCGAARRVRGGRGAARTWYCLRMGSATACHDVSACGCCTAQSGAPGAFV
jgi:hypothetical protein